MSKLGSGCLIAGALLELSCNGLLDVGGLRSLSGHPSTPVQLHYPKPHMRLLMCVLQSYKGSPHDSASLHPSINSSNATDLLDLRPCQAPFAPSFLHLAVIRIQHRFASSDILLVSHR